MTNGNYVQINRYSFSNLRNAKFKKIVFEMHILGYISTGLPMQKNVGTMNVTYLAEDRLHTQSTYTDSYTFQVL